MIQNQSIDKEQGHEIVSEFGIGDDYAGVWLATPAWAGPFFFFTGNTDGRSYAKHGLPRSKALSRYLIWRQRFGTKGIAGLRNRIAMVKNAA